MKHTMTITIPFYDVDSLKVVWHGRYVKYFEDARGELLEKIGCSYQKITELGFALPVVSMDIKYLRPCVCNQKINVNVSLEKSNHFLITKYEIRDFLNNELLCKAEVKQMAFDLKNMKSLYKLPEFLLSAISMA